MGLIPNAREEEENLNSWQPYLNKKSITLAVVSLLICCPIAYGLGAQNEQTITSNSNATTEVIVQSPVLGVVEMKGKENVDNACETKQFTEELENWDLSLFNPDKDGFYCPKRFIEFETPEIWYSELLPYDFREIKFKVETKANKQRDKPATVILSLGKNSRLTRFYFADNYQRVGFQKRDLSSGELIREDGKDITYPVMKEGIIEIRLQSVNERNNIYSHFYEVDYVPQRSEFTSSSDSFKYEGISIADPSPTKEEKILPIGLGTYKGECIKPISYEICY